MNSKRAFSMTVCATAFGVLLGFFVLHPFSMVMYHTMMMRGHHTEIADALAMSLDAFSGHMWLMGLFYAGFGGMFGYLVGTLMQRGRDLLSAELERKHHEAAKQLIEEITLTVTHYVRNANSAVGGYTRLAMKSCTDETVSKRLGVVIESSNQIDAVMSAMQTIDEKVEREEIGTTHLRMMNIREQINQYLKSKPAPALSTSASFEGDILR